MKKSAIDDKENLHQAHKTLSSLSPQRRLQTPEETLSVINLAGNYLSSLGEASLIKDLLTMLKNDLLQEFPLMKKAYETQQWDTLQRAVHKLRGGAVFCDASRLKVAASTLEQKLKSSQRQKNSLEIHFKTLEEEVGRFLVAYDALFGSQTDRS